MRSLLLSAWFCALLATRKVSGFTFLGKIKMPKLQSAEEKERISKAAEVFGDKAICVITGTSSGLGKQTCKALLETGRYHVIGAVRDIDKMRAVMEEEGFDAKNFTPIKCDLNSFASVRAFAKELGDVTFDRPVDRLVCNAALYQPLAEPQWSQDGIEQQMQTNFLSQFLLTSLMVPKMVASSSPRVIMVGSITGNDNTVGGGGVYPIADLRDLEGLRAGARSPVSMMDGRNFNGAKVGSRARDREGGAYSKFFHPPHPLLSQSFLPVPSPPSTHTLPIAPPRPTRTPSWPS